MKNTNEIKHVNFFWHALFVCKSVGQFITDKLSNRLEIINESFFDELFSFMNLSVKYLPTDYEFKYRQKFLLIKLLNLIVKFLKN